MNPASTKAALTSWILGGALLASLAVHAVQWSGAPAPAPAPAGAPIEVAPLLDSLELTEAQVQAIRDCCTGCCGERGTLEDAVAAAELRLRTALEATQVDVQRVRALARELGDLRGQCTVNAVDSILLVRDVLTPEQVGALIDCFRSLCDETR